MAQQNKQRPVCYHRPRGLGPLRKYRPPNGDSHMESFFRRPHLCPPEKEYAEGCFSQEGVHSGHLRIRDARRFAKLNEFNQKGTDGNEMNKQLIKLSLQKIGQIPAQYFVYGIGGSKDVLLGIDPNRVCGLPGLVTKTV